MTARAQHRYARFFLMMLVAVMWCLPFSRHAAAQERDELAPPARVGQLSLIFANVRMRIDRASTWEQGVLNTPISTGSAIATQLPGRSEVRIGSAALQMGQESQVVFAEVNDSSLHVEIVDGLGALRIRTLAPGERVQLSVKDVTVQILKPGAYRFSYKPDQARLRVWVLEGQARVALSQQSLMLSPRGQLQIERGIATPLTSSASEDHRSFDEFVDGRDRRSDSSLSRAHVSPEVTGIESLDGHGNWHDDASHGTVWFPSKVPSEWAPYRFGRWRWQAPWGWTWIDDAPWGFAPFHYGRWMFTGGRWGWAPGRLAAPNVPPPPVYAPALVAFFGNQAGAVWTTPASATPVVGWYPLAPGEVYWPAYSTQMAYVRALNAGSVSDVSQIQTAPAANSAGPSHRFSRTAFAASFMPYAAFQSQQDVTSNQIVLPPGVLAQAPLSGQRLPPQKPAAKRAEDIQ